MTDDNQLIIMPNVLEHWRREMQPIPYLPGQTVGDVVDQAHVAYPTVVLHNGRITHDLSQQLLPGDMVHIMPAMGRDETSLSLAMLGLSILAFTVISPAVSGALTAAGWGTTAAGIVGSLAAVATISAAGIIVNSTLAPARRDPASKSESPTYHWDLSENLAREGLAIPVIYGEVSSYPHVINQWLDIDSTTGEQWAHTVLCVAEGKTNNLPTADNIQADDQLLSHFDAVDYVIQATDGSAAPDWAGKTDFTQPHQMRRLDRRMKHTVISSFLLHCNGTNGSTSIVDDSGVSNNWTCQNTAALSTSSPFLGTAFLDMPGASDYVSCDNQAAFDIWTDDYFCVECRFRQSSSADAGIMGAERVDAGGDSYYWGIFWDATGEDIIFQMWKKTSGGVYTVYYNLTASPSTTWIATAWNHVCVQKWGASSLRIYINGIARGGPVSPSNTLVDPPAGTWAQAIGKAQYYDGATSDATWYIGGDIDEARLIKNGVTYNATYFTPPTTELTDTSSEEYIFTTKGTIDQFGIIITAPFGIYYAESDGSLSAQYTPFHISYRQAGETAWTTVYDVFNGATRNPWRERWDYTMPARGTYEIRIRRTGPDDISTRFQTTTLLSYVDEYLTMDLTYPYLQCIGISVKAQDEFSGRVPVFRVISNRTSVDVPDYHGCTKAVNATVNAYAAFDALTNNVYGGGVDVDRLIEADWEAWATWCNGLVGGQKRCQFNYIADAVASLDDMLQQVESCGRGRVVPRGSQIGVMLEKPADATAMFNHESTTPGTGNVTFLRQAERSDAVEITYFDKDLDYQPTPVMHKSDGYNSLTRQPRVVRATLAGINNRDQAQREAILRQQLSESIKRSVDLQTGLEGLPVQNGDVFKYVNSVNSFTGRLPRSNTRADQWTGTTVYLDRKINLDSTIFSSNCVLHVRDPDDSLQVYNVDGPFDTDTWYVNISASGTFNYLAPYIICRSTGEVYLYRVARLTRSSKLDISIYGLQYEESAHYNNQYESGTVAI